jgi:diguanylate cyclase (GGDEF)-like protein
MRPGILRKVNVIAAPTIAPETLNDEVAELFQNNSEVHAMAVLAHDKPVALVNRQQFMNHYATLYFRDVFGRRPAIEQANRQPRLIERDFNVEELLGILTSQDQRYLTEGFIVTDHGRYVGLGTGEQLVRTVTEARIESARHANPLTFLPGNIPITQHIDRLLATEATFVAAYADLNHFKPFNDHYGYWRGDEMIRLIARIITQHCDPQQDFVGHVGGDDFIILFQSQDWQIRCHNIIQQFAASALNLFDSEARSTGGIHAEDRHGVKRFFPCTTVSIGAVEVAAGVFGLPEEVANEAALAKHDAKLSPTGLSLRTATCH